jgi:hypothetical protein
MGLADSATSFLKMKIMTMLFSYRPTPQTCERRRFIHYRPLASTRRSSITMTLSVFVLSSLAMFSTTRMRSTSTLRTKATLKTTPGLWL